MRAQAGGGKHKVYDIEVEKVHSFSANGIVSHNCMIAHGSASFLKERLMDVSDKYSVFICNQCKIIATGNNKDNIYECKKCSNYSDFTKVYIPYACKLLLQELMTMSIGPRILTN